MEENKIILRTEGLVKRYGKRTVVNDVSFDVKQGAIVGLLGPNGAGKTTLLNILAGISEATSGECTVFGERVSKGQYSSGILSYLPDLPNFFDYLTVQEYINFILSGSIKKKTSLSLV